MFKINNSKIDQFCEAGISFLLPGVRSSTNVYWFYKDVDGMNFGDWIGPYLFEKINRRPPRRINPARLSNETSYFICGSILGHIRKKRSALVWGAGAIKPDICFPAPKKIYAVRGPLSREICRRQGYDCPSVFGDPGLLMPLFFKPDNIDIDKRVGVIPHFKDYELVERILGRTPDLHIIDVRRPVEEVIRDILTCKATISTSLHGLIVSHAYGVPSAWAIASDNIIGGEFKFRDYFLGAQFEELPKPIDLRENWSIDNLVRMAQIAPRLPEKWCSQRLMDVCPFLP
jgi:hypothetical protein